MLLRAPNGDVKFWRGATCFFKGEVQGGNLGSWIFVGFKTEVLKCNNGVSRVYGEHLTIATWCFQIFFYFHPYLWKIPILTNIFQMDWNHQLDSFLKICSQALFIFRLRQTMRTSRDLLSIGFCLLA